ncbi:hypothetical protein GCK32_013150 [Trichostrongylus colubriformis]|uniref:Uncharacterized protein n=1 Tax=Trichostrongylus colubriformis TaxID=6319 RepID=A0AAN8IGQ0_TRICO
MVISYAPSEFAHTSGLEDPPEQNQQNDERKEAFKHEKGRKDNKKWTRIRYVRTRIRCTQFTQQSASKDTKEGNYVRDIQCNIFANDAATHSA